MGEAITLFYLLNELLKIHSLQWALTENQSQ